MDNVIGYGSEVAFLSSGFNDHADKSRIDEIRFLTTRPPKHFMQLMRGIGLLNPIAHTYLTQRRHHADKLTQLKAIHYWRETGTSILSFGILFASHRI